MYTYIVAMSRFILLEIIVRIMLDINQETIFLINWKMNMFWGTRAVLDECMREIYFDIFDDVKQLSVRYNHRLDEFINCIFNLGKLHKSFNSFGCQRVVELRLNSFQSFCFYYLWIFITQWVLGGVENACVFPNSGSLGSIYYVLSFITSCVVLLWKF